MIDRLALILIATTVFGGCTGTAPPVAERADNEDCASIANDLNEQGAALARVTGHAPVPVRHQEFLDICNTLSKETRRCLRPSIQFYNFEQCNTQWETLTAQDRKRLKKLVNLGQTP